MKKSLFKNTIYKSILSFVNIVVPILIGPYVTRLLDVELYGVYNAVYSDFQVFLTIAAFGIYTFGIREISKIRNDKNKVASLFSNLFLISILANLAVIAAYLLYAFITSQGTALFLYLIMTIQLIGNIFYIEFVNEALENYKFISIKSVTIKIIYLILIFMLVKKPTDVNIYALIVSLVVFINNIVSFIYAKRFIKFDFSNIKIKKYLPSLITILVISNIELLYSQLDRVMLGKAVDGVAVTIYFIPYYILYTLASIPYSVIMVAIPRMSYLIANDTKEAYEKSLNKVISSLYFLIIPMCFGLVALAYEVIYIYAGENYLAAIPLLIVACIHRLFLSTESTMTHLVMYPNNKEKTLLKLTLGCGIVNLIVNILLVIFKVFTPFTAMFTTMLAEILLIAIEYSYISHKLKIKPIYFSKQNIRYLILSLLFIPIAYIVKLFKLKLILNVLIIIILCTSLYVGILMLVKDENVYLIINKFRRKNG